MRITYAVPKKVTFSQCDMFSHLTVATFLAWSEDIRFSIGEASQLGSFFKPEHRSEEVQEVLNHTGEVYTLPVIGAEINEKKKVRLGQDVLLHRWIEDMLMGQIVFRHALTDPFAKEIFIQAEYRVCVVGETTGLQHKLPEALAKRIQMFMDALPQMEEVCYCEGVL